MLFGLKRVERKKETEAGWSLKRRSGWAKLGLWRGPHLGFGWLCRGWAYGPKWGDEP